VSTSQPLSSDKEDLLGVRPIRRTFSVLFTAQARHPAHGLCDVWAGATGDLSGHPTGLTDCLEMKKPLPVLITTQVTPVNADLQRNRPAVADEP
jgi:hypothetical protein